MITPRMQFYYDNNKANFTTKILPTGMTTPVVRQFSFLLFQTQAFPKFRELAFKRASSGSFPHENENSGCESGLFGASARSETTASVSSRRNCDKAQAAPSVNTALVVRKRGAARRWQRSKSRRS